MITTADAMKVMLVVQACHQRTAPRMDDDEVTLTIASVWAELFNEHHLEFDDLVAAVKKRGQYHETAPEPAEIIRFAIGIRTDRADREDRIAREDRQAEHDVKADPEQTSTLATRFISGPTPPKHRTPRLLAAEEALQACTDKATAVAAISEYHAAKAEAKRGRPARDVWVGSGAPASTEAHQNASADHPGADGGVR